MERKRGGGEEMLKRGKGMKKATEKDLLTQKQM